MSDRSSPAEAPGGPGSASAGASPAVAEGFARRSLLRRLMDVVALPSSRGNIQDERSRRVELMLLRSAPAQTWFTSQCDDE